MHMTDLAAMFPFLKKMGCGRSKQHSPKPGEEEKNGPKEKSSSKKKKGKVQKKENKDPQPEKQDTNSSEQQQHHHHHHLHIKSPVKSIANALKPPPPPSNMNGSPRQVSGFVMDEESHSPPLHHHEKRMDHLGVPGGKGEMKEFRGKGNFKITHSAVAFFEMLDKKIEQGEDYHSDNSTEVKTPSDDES